ncbi:PucR family transcriptional regulator [Spirillospora sp. CA-142024]|uniref:PucR family transcriptional regulator n=1 Tax=Spirillospora sp. CA-142024 TaxID=3240036 RepID=UPI003D8C91C7
MDRNGVGLRQLLIALGEPLAELLAAPGGLDVEVSDIVILDPDDEPASYDGRLVLIIGARGRAAIRLIRDAALRGASAAAVKVTAGDDLDGLRDAADDTGIAVLGVRADARWDQLDALARSVVADARRMPEAEEAGDLFALAQTVAALTGGIVSIEDSTSRVLAYSRSDDEADELRRLSILGWQGPADFLALLREWGVFERLAAGDDVVRVDERPELGIRRRLAIGVRADAELMGTIWVQEGKNKLTERSESALLGAARVAALHLVRRRTGTTPGLRLQENLLTGALENRIDTDSLASNIGASPNRPAAIAAFSPSDPPDQPSRELRSAALTNLISVHAAAYRRSALATTIGKRVYVLLPDLPDHSAGATALGLAQEVVAAAGKSLALTVRAAIGSVVTTLADIGESKTEADRVLDVMAHDETLGVATIADVRAKVLISETLALLEHSPRLRDPRVTALVAHDADHRSDLVPSLLAYLDHLGDVRTAALRLRVHPNTLRHRLKRAASLSGLDFNDPHQRLFTHLQLLLETHGDGP